MFSDRPSQKKPFRTPNTNGEPASIIAAKNSNCPPVNCDQAGTANRLRVGTGSIQFRVFQKDRRLPVRCDSAICTDGLNSLRGQRAGVSPGTKGCWLRLLSTEISRLVQAPFSSHFLGLIGSMKKPAGRFCQRVWMVVDAVLLCLASF